MSVRRIMGTETEFGISVPGQPGANPMLTSSQVVNGYAQTQPLARKTRWDFDEEHPLRDARGFDLSRDVADPSQLTDEETGLANVILTNGARLYVDHAHPEYSTPECTNPRDVVIWDKAGELVIVEGARQARQVPGVPRSTCTRTTPTTRARRTAPHENYLMRAVHPVRLDRAAPDPVLRQPPGGHRRRPGRARPGRRRRTASRSASGPTTSRSRSGWRPR